MEHKKQIFYRGLLKSCNYSCEYCPFSKHISLKELNGDKAALDRFIEFVESARLNIGAILFVPYGEALIHKYYWENMALLSKCNEIEVIGCQTNLSFPVHKMLDVFKNLSGNIEKLRLWCTFHPIMVSKETFIEQCNLLIQNKVLFSVGAVGVPENIERLKEFRKNLPSSIYFWINPMDGLGRKYTEEEIETFCEMDPFFIYNLRLKKSKPQYCNGCNGHSMFVNYKGDITPCNISRKKIGNLYDEDIDKLFFQKEEVINCGKKECSCFLSYCNRTDFKELMFYGKYPAFRIPEIPKIMFLDVDGTIVKTGSDTIEDHMAEQIKYWSKFSKIYLATSLPFNHTMKKCSKIKKYLSGGIFANGGMYWIFEENKKNIVPFTTDLSSFIEDMKYRHGMKVRLYKENGITYKIVCKGGFAKEAKEQLLNNYKGEPLHIVLEEDYLEVTAKKATKLNAVMKICDYYGYKKEEVFAAGNSENDIEMLNFAGYSLYISQEMLLHFTH